MITPGRGFCGSGDGKTDRQGHIRSTRLAAGLNMAIPHGKVCGIPQDAERRPIHGRALEVTAYHEAGHALVELLLPSLRDRLIFCFDRSRFQWIFWFYGHAGIGRDQDPLGSIGSADPDPWRLHGRAPEIREECHHHRGRRGTWVQSLPSPQHGRGFHWPAWIQRSLPRVECARQKSHRMPSASGAQPHCGTQSACARGVGETPGRSRTHRYSADRQTSACAGCVAARRDAGGKHIGIKKPQQHIRLGHIGY